MLESDFSGQTGLFPSEYHIMFVVISVDNPMIG